MVNHNYRYVPQVVIYWEQEILQLLLSVYYIYLVGVWLKLLLNDKVCDGVLCVEPCKGHVTISHVTLEITNWSVILVW